MNLRFSKPEKDYLIRNFHKLSTSEKFDVAKKERLRILAEKLNRPDTITKLNPKQVDAVVVLSTYTIYILNDITIPEYEKRIATAKTDEDKDKYKGYVDGAKVALDIAKSISKKVAAKKELAKRRR